MQELHKVEILRGKPLDARNGTGQLPLQSYKTIWLTRIVRRIE